VKGLPIIDAIRQLLTLSSFFSGCRLSNATIIATIAVIDTKLKDSQAIFAREKLIGLTQLSFFKELMSQTSLENVEDAGVLY